MIERSLLLFLFTLLCRHQYCVATAINAGLDGKSWTTTSEEEEQGLLHRRLDDRNDDPSERDAYGTSRVLLVHGLI